MSDIMKMKNLKNKVHRDGFDLSRRVGFTSKVGELNVVDFIPCIPGDKHELDLSSFTRTQPLQTATLGRLREYYDVFFVPYRLLWSPFNDWVLQGNHSNIAKSWNSAAGQTETCPFITKDQIFTIISSRAFQQPFELDETNQSDYTRAECSLKLLEYCGLGVESLKNTSSVAINIWTLLAYQKIYQDYFRFSQWEDVAPWTYNLDWLNVGDDMNMYLDQNDYEGVSSPFDLRFVNYDKDYFHGILPSPQYGDTAIASPITGELRGNLQISASDGTTNMAPLFINKGTGYVQYQGDSSFNGTKTANVYANLNQILESNTNNAGLSVLSIRYAEMFQKWKEITLSSSDRSVKSLLEKHWNVNVSDYFSDKCQYLGGIKQNIDINSVVNQNLADSSSRADIHGMGVATGNGKINVNVKEYGVVMILHHAKPIIDWDYNKVFDKSYLQITPQSFPIPEFDNIGMEGVKAFEFLSSSWVSQSISDKVVGYAPRYVNYKTSFDKVKGEFLRSLKPWFLPFSQTSDDVDYKTFKVNPHIVDNLFGVAANGNTNTDHLQCLCYMNVKSVRNLSRDGLPY